MNGKVAKKAKEQEKLTEQQTRELEQRKEQEKSAKEERAEPKEDIKELQNYNEMKDQVSEVSDQIVSKLLEKIKLLETTLKKNKLISQGETEEIKNRLKQVEKLNKGLHKVKEQNLEIIQQMHETGKAYAASNDEAREILLKTIRGLEKRKKELQEQLEHSFTGDESEGENSPKGKKRLRTVSLWEDKTNTNGKRGAETSSTVQEGNLPQATAPHTSLKYAMELISKFDGHNNPIRDSINECKRAKKMISPNSEEYSEQIVRGRVQGEARRALKGLEIQSMDSSCQYFGEIYKPAQNRDMLDEELIRIHQKNYEGMVSYTNRVKELSEKIIEATDTSQMTVESRISTMKKIEADTVKCLISGLKPEYELTVPKDKDLVNTIQDLIQLEKEIKLRKELQSKPTTSSKGGYRERRRSVHAATSESIKCEYCEKTGHAVDKCYKKIYQERREEYMRSVKCYFCNKLGHFARECLKKENEEARKTKDAKQGNEQSPSQTGAWQESGEIARPVYPVQEVTRTTNQQQLNEETPVKTEDTFWEQCE